MTSREVLPFIENGQKYNLGPQPYQRNGWLAKSYRDQQILDDLVDGLMAEALRDDSEMLAEFPGNQSR